MTALSKYRLRFFENIGYMYKKIIIKQKLLFWLLKIIEIKEENSKF